VFGLIPNVLYPLGRKRRGKTVKSGQEIFGSGSAGIGSRRSLVLRCLSFDRGRKTAFLESTSVEVLATSQAVSAIPRRNSGLGGLGR